MLFAGLYMVAVGASGVKAAAPLLGADQFDDKNPEETAQLSSYFNWLMFSANGGAMVGVTFIVWFSSNKGWDWAFGISSVSVLLTLVLICVGKPFYRDNVPKGSPLVRILQVLAAACHNRDLPPPKVEDKLHEIYDKEAGVQNEILQRTKQFRFLDRAAIVRDSGSASAGGWRLCTVTQVEETKIVIRVLPIIICTVFFSTCMAQIQTFSIQQSTTMDTRIHGFKIPGPSLPVIPLIFLLILIPLYDRLFVPLARRITGIPTGIRLLQRIGAGLLLSAVSMAVSGIVETWRKSVAIEHEMIDSTEPLPISVFWLSFQFCIMGLAEMFTMIGLLDFYYAESSAGMKSTSTVVSWCSLGLGYFMSSVVVEVVNAASGGWLGSNNLNRTKLNYFYWLLFGLSVLNFGIFIVSACFYEYKKVEDKQGENCESDLPVGNFKAKFQDHELFVEDF